jgi:hypothetical protein
MVSIDSRGLISSINADERAIYEILEARGIPTLRNEAFTERNKIAVCLAKAAIALGGNAGVAQHDPEDKTWDPEWRTILFIDLPGVGQLSWHFHDRDRGLLEGMLSYEDDWDGHTTEDKYSRMVTREVENCMDLCRVRMGY